MGLASPEASGSKYFIIRNISYIASLASPEASGSKSNSFHISFISFSGLASPEASGSKYYPIHNTPFCISSSLS